MVLTRRLILVACFAMPVATTLMMEAAMADTIPSDILTAWNEPNDEIRRQIVEATTTPDLSYDDVHKNDQTLGQAEFLDFLTFFRSRVSDVQMTLDGPVEQLPGAARIRFALMRGDAVFSRGTYFATLSEDGRISGLFGFMDQEPSQ